MGSGICRFGDETIGKCLCNDEHGTQPGIIIDMAPTVTANGVGVARFTGAVLSACNHVGSIITSSNSVTTNGLGIARFNDQFSGCYLGVVITGSNNVVAGG